MTTVVRIVTLHSVLMGFVAIAVRGTPVRVRLRTRSECLSVAALRGGRGRSKLLAHKVRMRNRNARAAFVAMHLLTAERVSVAIVVIV